VSHSLFTGITECGKSTAIKKVCKDLLSKGVKSWILTPHSHGWPDGVETTNDPGRFMYVAKRAENCHLVVDEGKYFKDNEMDWLTSESRHGGNFASIAAVYYRMVSPLIRGQCVNIIAFGCTPHDAKILAEERGKIFLECADLPQGHYIRKSNFGQAIRGRAF